MTRVGFFGQSGPYAPPVLRYLLARGDALELVLVVEGKKKATGRMEHRLRKPKPGPFPSDASLAELGRAGGVAVLETCDVNAPTAVRTIADFGLEWIVCVGFDRLFSPAVLATAARGGLNLHPSLLPRWRGPSPLFWALKMGERAWGVTLHGMDEKEDHGPIYAQESFIIPRRAAGEEVYRLAAELGARLIAGALERARAGALVGTPQRHELASRAPRPRPEDAFVEPSAWGCDHLVDFACGAPYFRAPCLKLGEDVFYARRGIRAEPGRRMPAQFALAGSTLVVQCKDGLAHLEVQV